MIPGLNGLRAIAFLSVFLFHTQYFDAGWMGVQLFFVLSGFLITGILINMKKSLSVKDYFIKFYGRRFLRIFPLYYFYLAVMGILATWLISINYRPGWMELFTDQAKYAVYYIFNFYAATDLHTDTHFLTHFWSLSMEEQFYIFWPLLVLFTPEKYYRHLFVSLIILGPFFRVGELLIYNTGLISMLADTPEQSIYALPLTHIDAFAFGAYISRYPIAHAKQQFLVLLGIIPLVGFTTQYIATGETGSISAFGYPLLMGNGYQFIWGYSLLNYFFAVIIYVVAKSGLFTNILEWAPLQYLGKISYGLYIYHNPIVWFALDIKELGILADDAVKPVAALLAFLATFLIASASYHFLEKPILNLKDRFFAH